MTRNEQALPVQALLPCPFCDQAPNLFRGGPPLARAEWAACYGKKPGFKHEYIAMPLPAWQNRLAHTRPAVSDGAGEALSVEPWANFHGDLPDYDHPLRCVYESGIQYAVNLLAKELGVADWELCDGTEDFDGDLGGTLMNIVMAALPTDEHGDPLRPSEIRERFSALSQPASGGVAREKVLREALLQIEFRSTNHGAWFEQDPFGEYSKLGDIARAALAAPGQDEGEGS